MTGKEKTPERFRIPQASVKLSSVHIIRSAGLHLSQQSRQQLQLRLGQIPGDAVLPTLEDAGDLRQQVQGLLGGMQLHDPLVGSGGNPGDEAILLQTGCLPGHVALVDADALGELVLRDAGMGADLREIAGMAGLQTHGCQAVGPILSTTAGDFCNITDDLRHGVSSFGKKY